MPVFQSWRFAAIFAAILIAAAGWAQSAGNSGSIDGTVVDSTGAVVPKATVEIRNPVSGFDRSTTTDNSGRFEFTNIPFNPYHLTVTAADICALRARRGTTLFSSGERSRQTASGDFDRTGHGSGGSGRLDRERSDVPYRRGSESIRQGAAGKRVVVGEFAGYAGYSGNRGRLQWPIPRLGRPRGKFLFGGWPADHRSAEQGLLQPDSDGFDPVNGSDFGGSAGGIWRQDERRD